MELTTQAGSKWVSQQQQPRVGEVLRALMAPGGRGNSSKPGDGKARAHPRKVVPGGTSQVLRRMSRVRTRFDQICNQIGAGCLGEGKQGHKIMEAERSEGGCHFSRDERAWTRWRPREWWGTNCSGQLEGEDQTGLGDWLARECGVCGGGEPNVQVSG